ncbi:hypothetical protein HanIR_Chr15g0754741 [Helianthus annuus]|nr:hypothetical protein HanIR_Chr15g0754741 [Helianthus annuus]
MTQEGKSRGVLYPGEQPPHIVRIDYSHSYQTAPGVVIASGTPVVIDRGPLPCCGCGIGWFLFLLGSSVGPFPGMWELSYYSLCGLIIEKSLDLLPAP